MRTSTSVDDIELATELFDDAWGHLRGAQVEAALAVFQECRQIYERVGDAEGMADVDDAIGLTLCHLGRQRDAFEAHVHAYAVLAGFDNWTCAEHAAANAAWAAMEGGDADLAVVWADHAVVAASRAGDADGGWSTQLVRARTLIAAGRIEEAGAIIEAHPCSDDSDDASLAFASRVKAALAVSQGRPEDAADLFAYAVDRYIRAGDILEARCTEREMRAGY